jgi:hypothetical protein
MPDLENTERQSETGSFEIELMTDRRGAEVLSLELRMLAKAHGLQVAKLTVIPAEEITVAPEPAPLP